MSTKSKIVQSLYRYSDHRSGPYQRRQKRINFMHKIVDDLHTARLLPRHWRQLTGETIKKLTVFWQYEKKLKPSTIMNNLGVFRHFCRYYQLSAEFPTNLSLGLRKKRKQYNSLHNPLDFLERFASAEAKYIVGLSVYFGLTTKEAMKLNPLLDIYQNSVQISRNIGFNYKERSIPIVTPEQDEFIKAYNSFTGKTALIKQSSYQILNKKLRDALKSCGIPSNLQFRRYYIQYRLKTLIELSPKIQRNILLAETGLSKVQLRSYCNE